MPPIFRKMSDSVQELNSNKRDNVTAGANCQISPQASLRNVVLGDNVRVADGVQLWNVVVGGDSKISRNVTLYSNVAERPVLVGKWCWISFGVFGEGTGGEIKIEDHVTIAHLSTILSGSGPGVNSPILSQLYPDQLGPVVIGAHSWVGAHCLILPEVVLEEGVVIAANSVVKTRCESWSVYGGSPAKLLKKMPANMVEVARSRWRTGFISPAGR